MKQLLEGVSSEESNKQKGLLRFLVVLCLADLSSDLDFLEKLCAIHPRIKADVELETKNYTPRIVSNAFKNMKKRILFAEEQLSEEAHDLDDEQQRKLVESVLREPLPSVDEGEHTGILGNTFKAFTEKALSLISGNY